MTRGSKMPLQQRENNGERAYVSLRSMIVDGRLPPGGWLIESDLTERLHMSRTPIRAALQWLQHEGYVIECGTGSKSRMMIAPLTLSDSRELYAIVGAIEGIAGRHAAELPAKARDTIVTTLQRLNSTMVKTSKSSDPDLGFFADTDTAFHDRIVESAAGPRLLAIYKAIKPQTDRYWLFYSRFIKEDMARSCAEHHQIVRSISRGDAEAAQRNLQINWANGAERLEKAIAKFGEQGTFLSGITSTIVRSNGQGAEGDSPRNGRAERR
jgi:DNA-binding GntR family transcriptional regulator